MKKIVAVFGIFCILVLAVSCSSDTKTSVRSNSLEGASTSQWPTKKWSISTPEAQGMDARLLANADKRVKENYPNIYSLIVVRHGYLVYEKYYQKQTNLVQILFIR